MESRACIFVGELPCGYEYKILKVFDKFNKERLHIVGIAIDKEPIGFSLSNDGIWTRMAIEPDFGGKND
ncbi:MAG TPA: hypothetical protein VNU45_17980 [Rummeliibacillus sp.]|nr:hypothetical protein [Rummeliibacillus sp.]